MEILEKWLKDWALAISLILALAVSCALGSDGVVSEHNVPLGDGEHYVLRALTLYGYLHSGQWARFWDVFTLPKQSLAPLHYWIFFLLPTACASLTSYGVIQAATTYGLLAVGSWDLCRILGRTAWAPALFLLCASQNISLDYSYFYFADVPFMALGTIALAAQIRAWREVGGRNSIVSGLVAGLMFWVKAPNAVIFAGTYFLAEIAHALIVWLETRKNPGPAHLFRKQIVRHIVALAAGFLPIVFLALASGGFQSIVRLIDANEVSGFFVTHLECTGLLRFFYFPLCLTFFYHAEAMLLIFILALLASILMSWSRPVCATPVSAATPFPATHFVPLITAYLILGEVFSFGMANKEMRSLLLVLPVFWLAVFWAMEHWWVRPGCLFLTAVAYVLCAYSQLFFNVFGSKDVSTEGYQLKDDWLSRLPQKYIDVTNGEALTESVLTTIQLALPNGGKVAVGTEHLFFTSESLSWVLQYNPSLKGRRAPYLFENFLTSDGSYCRSALLNARGVLILLHPTLQYSHEVQQASVGIARFGTESWVADQFAQIVPVRAASSVYIGCLFVTREPLDDAHITALIKSTTGRELPPEVEFNPPVDRRLSLRESWDILMRWKQKRWGN